jgi:hypothetical protein
MNKKQENKFTMYLAVRDALAEFQGAWNGMAGFVNAHSGFVGVISSIEETEQRIQKVYRGITLDKEALCVAMVDVAEVVMGGVLAYANSIGNHTLAERMSVTRWELIEMRDTTQVEHCQMVYQESMAVAASIGDFGVDGVMLAQFLGAIEAYAANVASPRIAIGVKSEAVIELESLFASGDFILKKQLDLLMKGMRLTAVGFYRRYKSSRVIVDV